MNRSHTSLASLVVVVALASASSAAAQPSTGELRDDLVVTRVAGELGLGYLDRSGTEVVALQPSVYGDFVLLYTDPLLVSIDFAWRAVGTAGDFSAFRAGNPFFGVRVGYFADGLRARGGVGLTLPLTNAYDDFRGSSLVGGGGAEALVSMFMANAMQQSWDYWLQSYLNMALVFRGDVEYRSDFFAAGGEVAVAPMFPVEYEGRAGDTVVGMQAAVWGAVRPVEMLALGARLQTSVLIPTTDGADPIGFGSVVPFVRGELDQAFVEARFSVSLVPDNYEAIYGPGEHPWSVYLLGGVALESPGDTVAEEPSYGY